MDSQVVATPSAYVRSTLRCQDRAQAARANGCTAAVKVESLDVGCAASAEVESLDVVIRNSGGVSVKIVDKNDATSVCEPSLSDEKPKVIFCDAADLQPWLLIELEERQQIPKKFLVTKFGGRYHDLMAERSHDCLRNRNRNLPLREVTQEEAENMDRTPCQVCLPNGP